MYAILEPNVKLIQSLDGGYIASAMCSFTNP